MTSRPNRQLLVWAIILSQVGPPFMFSGVAVALPHLGEDLGAGAISQGLVETLFLAGSVAFLLPVGRLADATDKNTLFLAGLATFVLTSLAIAALSWMPGIIALRFLQGVASALCATSGPAIVADIVPPEKRGRAYGSLIGTIYAGLTLGPVLAGIFIDLWGWRAVFVTGAAVIALGLLVVASMLERRWRAPKDLSGHALSTALIAGSVLAIVGGSALVSLGAIGYACFALGLALAVFFVARERRLARPLLDVRALAANAVLRNALLVQLLLYVNAFCAVFLLSLYLQNVLGYEAPVAGRTLAVGSVLMAVIAPFAGALADRIRPTTLASIGVLALLGSTLLATQLDRGSSLWFVMAMLALQGVGFALFSSPNMTLIMNSVPPSEVSMASALGAKARSIGTFSGMILTGTLLSITLGEAKVEDNADEFVSLMNTTFSMLVVVTFVALIASILGRQR